MGEHLRLVTCGWCAFKLICYGNDGQFERACWMVCRFVCNLCQYWPREVIVMFDGWSKQYAKCNTKGWFIQVDLFVRPMVIVGITLIIMSLTWLDDCYCDLIRVQFVLLCLIAVCFVSFILKLFKRFTISGKIRQFDQSTLLFLRLFSQESKNRSSKNLPTSDGKLPSGQQICQRSFDRYHFLDLMVRLKTSTNHNPQAEP